MRSNNVKLLEFALRIIFPIPGLTGTLKLFAHQLVSFWFSDLSSNLIEHIENSQASKPFRSEDELRSAAVPFTKAQRIMLLASLHMLQDKAAEEDNITTTRKIVAQIDRLIPLLELTHDQEAIDHAKHDFQQRFYQFQQRPVVEISTTLWPLALDYVLRCLLLLGFSYFNFDKTALIGFNTTVIPVLIFAIAYFVGKQARKKNVEVLEGYGGIRQFQLRFAISTTQYTWLAFFLGSSVFISALLPEQLHVAALLALPLYYFVYLRFFRFGTIAENALVQQLEARQKDFLKLNADENDEAIVAFETRLTSHTSRLEAYVLESALFGALSFSGFLQIMAADLVSFQDLENFAGQIFAASKAFIHFDWPSFDAATGQLSNKVNLFCLVSVESLVCSIFFLAVIASRLRFSNIADRVRTALNLAKAYNVKEEVVHEEVAGTGQKAKRLEALTYRVNLQLAEANRMLREINPVMEYMQYFRNAGILVFLVILVSSSLFITRALAWTFIVLALGTVLYFRRAQLALAIRAFGLNFRIYFIRNVVLLFAAAFGLQVLGYILRIFLHVRATDGLMALSSLSIAIIVSLWLILAAHVDNEFGEIDQNTKEQQRISRWTFFKNIVAGLILLLGVGMAAKQLSLSGANVMIMVSLNSLGFAMYPFGYYLCKKRWLGVLLMVLIAMVFIGVLFKVLHFQGADEMLILSTLLFFVLIPIVRWKRHLFHQLFMKFCIACALISIYHAPFFMAPFKLQLAYAHETTQVAGLLEVLNANSAEQLTRSDETLRTGLKKADLYLNRYGANLGITEIHQNLISAYYDFLSLSERNPPDTVLWQQKLLVARQANKIIQTFGHNQFSFFDPLQEPQLLIEHHQDDQARLALIRILADQTLAADVRKKGEAMLQRIETRPG